LCWPALAAVAARGYLYLGALADALLAVARSAARGTQPAYRRSPAMRIPN